MEAERRTKATTTGLVVVLCTWSLMACAEEVAPITFDSVVAETAAPATVPPSTAAAADPVATDPGDTIGAAWEDATGDLAGLDSECGNLSFVAARPDRRGLLTTVALQGVWESVDGGGTWERLGQGEGSAEVTLRGTDVVFDPDDPTTFWVSGLYNGGGVYQTTDDGATFEQLGSMWSAEDVGVDFTDPERQTLVAPQHERTDIYRSVDGGSTWTDISGTLPADGGHAVATVVLDADTYLLGLRDGRVPGVFRTTDAGATWTRVHPTEVTGEPIRAADGDLYWLIARGGGLLTSADDGVSWTEIPSGSIAPFTTSLIELPDGRFVSVSDSSLIASSDSGISWQTLGPALPYEPTGVLYSPFDGAFYAWRFDCDFGANNPVQPGSIVGLTFEPRSA